MRISNEGLSVFLPFVAICAVASGIGAAIIQTYPRSQPAQITTSLAQSTSLDATRESSTTTAPAAPDPEAALSKDGQKRLAEFEALVAFQEFLAAHPRLGISEITAWLDHMRARHFHHSPSKPVVSGGERAGVARPVLTNRARSQNPAQVQTLPMASPALPPFPQPTAMVVPTYFWPAARYAPPAVQPRPPIIPSQSTYIEHAQSPETPHALVDTSRWPVRGPVGCPLSLGNGCR